jgi:hypothetical protein
MKPKSPELKFSTLDVFILVTFRAALIWLLRQIIAPMFFASGETQILTAFSRLRGPSKQVCA